MGVREGKAEGKAQTEKVWIRCRCASRKEIREGDGGEDAEMEECEEAKEKQKVRVTERESKGGKLSGGKAT